MQQYWISDGTQQFGPYPIEELLDRGLQPHWLVWTEGMDNWVRADTVDAIRPLFNSTSPLTPLEPSPHSSPTPPPPPQPVTPLGYHHYPQTTALPQTMAIVSLVCSLVGLVGMFPASLIGIVFGHLALGRIRRGEESGHGMAVAGLILGYIVTIFWVVVIVGFCALPCIVGL